MNKFALPLAVAAAFTLAGCWGDDEDNTSAGNDNRTAVESTAAAPAQSFVKEGYLFTFDFNLASEKHDGTYQGTVRAYCSQDDHLRLEEYKEACRERIMRGFSFYVNDPERRSMLGTYVATDNPEIRPNALVGGDDWIHRAVRPLNSYPIAVVRELEFTPN